MPTQLVKFKKHTKLNLIKNCCFKKSTNCKLTLYSHNILTCVNINSTFFDSISLNKFDTSVMLYIDEESVIIEHSAANGAGRV